MWSYVMRENVVTDLCSQNCRTCSLGQSYLIAFSELRRKDEKNMSSGSTRRVGFVNVLEGHSL